MIKKSPYISIVLLCYNYEKYLSRALEAISAQTFYDYELIFVDNGCTDKSAEIALKFKKNHPEININIITVPVNQGAAYGENIGVQAATGKYLMFHDADDWMDSNTLELLAEKAKETNADRIICAFRDVDDNGHVKQVQALGDKPNAWVYGMQQGNLFKRSLYVENNITTSTFWLDSEKTYKYSAVSNTAAFVFEPCYNYFVHLDSTSRNKTLYKRLFEEQYSFENFLKVCVPFLKQIHDETNYCYAEYQLSRCYYSYIFQFLRDAPLKTKFEYYSKLRKTMITYVPDYLKQTQSALKEKRLTRSYARIVAELSYYLERLHLFKLGLIGYHILSKVIYFQV